MPYLFPASEWPTLPVTGEPATYPVRRIFCVGRNYAAHAAEMGNEVDREAPFYFTKSALAATSSGATVPYPPGTSDFHHEMELVVAIGAPAFHTPRDRAMAAVFGYGCGIDLTRRDLQAAAKDKRRPWDTSKDFEQAAILGPLTRAAAAGELGPKRIWLSVNDQPRQDALLADMIHDVAGIIADLSKFYHLGPGDIIMTGTPAGVGPLVPGDRVEGGIDGLAPINLRVGPPENP